MISLHPITPIIGVAAALAVEYIVYGRQRLNRVNIYRAKHGLRPLPYLLSGSAMTLQWWGNAHEPEDLQIKSKTTNSIVLFIGTLMIVMEVLP